MWGLKRAPRLSKREAEDDYPQQDKMRGVRKMCRGVPVGGALSHRQGNLCKRRLVPFMRCLRGNLSGRGDYLEYHTLSRPVNGWDHGKSRDEIHGIPVFPGRRQGGAPAFWPAGTLTVKAVRLLISGKVQGVFYRYTARKVASRLDIRGWVKNLPGGEVEAVAAGTPAAIEAFIAWCREGPPGARVADVEVAELPSPPDYEDFSVTY